MTSVIGVRLYPTEHAAAARARHVCETCQKCFLTDLKLPLYFRPKTYITQLASPSDSYVGKADARAINPRERVAILC